MELKLLSEKQNRIDVKKSKFFAFSFFLNSEEDVKSKLLEVKAKYRDARHVVWAYRLRENGVLREKYTDDKEPSGSAGSAILFLLKKREIINCLIVVVRYFGGIKLGKGGLARAYTASAQQVLEDNVDLK